MWTTIIALILALALPALAEEQGAAGKVESGMDRGANATERGLSKAGHATGHAIGTAIEKTGKGVGWVIDKTGKGFEKAGQAMQK
jgi:hypothetical protein